MIVWNQSQESINASRARGSAAFKRKGARKCSLCTKIFPSMQKLCGHMISEHRIRKGDNDRMVTENNKTKKTIFAN
ncbi:hypothetical protein A3K80_07460 [Candidatus Bathyarchaeota archaeon RBG_13_38_9]|nr:MAG: hypothetical protein A3K80_07460 [Candidatus Bathyarchaeota archaeon RBG_13_38_9]